MYRLAALLLLAWLATAAAGCGSPTVDGSPIPPGPSPAVTAPYELPVVVTVAGNFRDEEIAFLDRQIAAFEAIEAGARIELIDLRGAGSQALGEGEHADLVLVDDSLLAGYGSEEAIQSIGPFLHPTQEQMSALLPSAVEACRVGGLLVGLPWTLDGGLLYSRRDLLERYGYGVPDSYAELRAMAGEIQARESLTYGYVWQGSASESLTHNTLEVLRGFGGQVLDDAGEVVFDSPETRTALEFMVDLVASGVSPPDSARYAEGQALKVFSGGEAVFLRHWAAALSALDGPDSPLKDRVGVGPLPSSSLFVRAWVLPASSLHPALAMEFAAFLGSYEAQVSLGLELGRPPALKAAYGDARLLAERPLFADVGAALAQSRPRPRSDVYPELSRVIYDNLHAMLLGERDPTATAAQVDAALRRLVR